MTMIGTLYGTLEVGVSIADEILRSFSRDWTQRTARRVRMSTIVWCAVGALIILGWLFLRQYDTESAEAGPALAKPRLLLALLTPANLFTGVLSCGLICLLNLWMDRKYIPSGLRMPGWLFLLNVVAGILLLSLGIKGYWDFHDPDGPFFAQRWFPICGLVGMAMLASIAAHLLDFQGDTDG